MHCAPKVERSVGCLVILALAFFTMSCSKKMVTSNLPMTFSSSSRDLARTVLVPTLDTPVTEGKNVIWCASFQASWKKIQHATGEVTSMEGSSLIVERLNNSPDVNPEIPSNSLYAAAGWLENDIISQITRDMKQRFPQQPLPKFESAALSAPKAFVSYSYLEATLLFSHAYHENPQPLTFIGSDGKSAEISSFGILQEDSDNYEKLRSQPRVIFRSGHGAEDDFEFAIDLCADSSPNQIVVARISPGPTLAVSLARVEELGARPPLDSYSRTFGITDVLLVPDLYWFVSHQFSEIEGKSFTNTKLHGDVLVGARQDIVFRLDRDGAMLKSHSSIFVASSSLTAFALDRPFLIYMKMRGAKSPYFVMWVDNPELLRQWQRSSD